MILRTLLNLLRGGLNTPPAVPDVVVIQKAIRKRYGRVSRCADGLFKYPTGRAGAEGLGYDPTLVAAAPQEMMASFCGVGNPLSLGEISAGSTVLDIGCGAGFDLFCAARAIGPSGKAIGIDLTPEMVDRARTHLELAGVTNAEIHNASVEQIPLQNGTADLVISNGVLNLSPIKEQMFSEIARVLKQGGVLQFADIVLSQELAANQKSASAWSN